MRFVTTLTLGSVLALSGCGSDSSSGTGGSGGSGAPPAITMVAWETVPSCERGSRTDYDVTVTVSDPDTNEGDLTYSGSVGGFVSNVDSSAGGPNCRSDL